MRAQRQKIKLLQEGGADDQEIILAKAKYQGQMQTYKDFSEKMKLPEQKARIMQDGLKGKFMPTKAELEKIAPPTLKNAAGQDIIEVKRTRNYYDENGKQYKQISNNNHGNAKMHPYGKNGEHAHDYVYEDGKLIDRPTRELTENERKENLDIL